MAFFNEIGRKISQTGQDAVKKVKDASEVSRLNSQIAEEEKTMNAVFSQMGKHYFEKCCAEDVAMEEPCASWIEYIKTAQVKITQYKEEIRRIQDVIRCPGCGAECSYAVPFCGNCGMNLAEARIAADNAPHCPACGAQVSDSAVFCASCGSRIATEE